LEDVFPNVMTISADPTPVGVTEGVEIAPLANPAEPPESAQHLRALVPAQGKHAAMTAADHRVENGMVNVVNS
jgi:hypothetical protein